MLLLSSYLNRIFCLVAARTNKAVEAGFAVVEAEALVVAEVRKAVEVVGRSRLKN